MTGLVTSARPANEQIRLGIKEAPLARDVALLASGSAWPGSSSTTGPAPSSAPSADRGLHGHAVFFATWPIFIRGPSSPC